jgi:hypothetical protein
VRKRGDKTNKISYCGLVYKPSDKQTTTSGGCGIFFFDGLCSLSLIVGIRGINKRVYFDLTDGVHVKEF